MIEPQPATENVQAIPPISAGDGVATAPATPQSSVTRRALGNSAFLAAYYAADAAMLFAINLLLARGLGVTEYGKLAFALSFGLLLASMDFGFCLAITKLVARDARRGSPWIEAAMSLRWTFTTVQLAVVGLAVFVPGYMHNNAVFIAMVAGSEILRTIPQACCAVFRGFQSMTWEALVFGIERSVLLTGSALLLHAGYGTKAIGMMFLGARSFAMIVSLVVLRIKAGPIRYRLWPKEAPALLKETYPLSLLSLSGVVTLQLPPLLLTFLIGAAASGIFQVSAKVVMFPILVCSVMGMGVFPAMSAAHDDLAQVQKLHRYGIRLLWHCLLPCGIMTTFFARPIVDALFGKQYAGAVPVLQLMTPYYLLQVIVTMGYYMLTAVNRQRTVMTLGLVSMGMNATIGAAMMKFFGPSGAALTFSVTNLVMAACYWRLATRHRAPGTSGRRDLWQWIGVAGMVAGFAWLAPHMPVHGWTELILTGLLTLAVYAVMLLVTGSVLPEELRLIMSVKSRVFGRA